MSTRWIRIVWATGALLVAGGAAYAALPGLLPRILERIRPDMVFRGDSRRKVIYLTIDDAPTPATGEILRVLAKHRVPATFFVISGRVRSDSDLRAITQAGHLLGNHMRTTRACTRLSLEEFQADFDKTDQVIGRFPGARSFRPPSGYCTERQAAYAKSRGYITVVGTMYPFDAGIQNQAVLKFLIKWLTVPGGILIMHDGDPRAATTAAVLNQIIPDLKQHGYEFASLEGLEPPKKPN